MNKILKTVIQICDWVNGTGWERGGHYAFTTTVYPDIWVILGDVNQSGRPVYQNVAHEKLVE